MVERERERERERETLVENFLQFAMFNCLSGLC